MCDFLIAFFPHASSLAFYIMSMYAIEPLPKWRRMEGSIHAQHSAMQAEVDGKKEQLAGRCELVSGGTDRFAN